MKANGKQYLKSHWLLALPIFAASNSIGAPDISKVIPGQYIVVLKQDAQRAEVANAHGLNPARTYSHALNGFAASIPEGRLNALQNDPRVQFVEADLEVSALAQTIPTGVQRIGATLSPAAKIDGLDERVNADIAIIDTGIDLTHPDLNVYQHVSFSASNTTGNDGHGHGTHVAGTAAALDNGIGVVGVAPGARLWAVKVLDDSGSGSLSAIIAGVDYVTQNASQIEVANLSLGGQGTSDSLRLAIKNSVATGVVYVVAAGNAGVEIYGGDSTFGTFDDFFPASYPEVMTVSALADTDGNAGGAGASTSYGADDTIATFSCYSRVALLTNPVDSPGLGIDVAAPGVNIYSTYKGGAYATMSGTSMASPHVAGAVALYIAQYGRAVDAAGVAHIRQTLIGLAEAQYKWGINPTDPHPMDKYPESLVNVSSIGSSVTPSVNNPPTVLITSPANSSSFSADQRESFFGIASDAEDGDITSRLFWYSSIDGYLGTSTSSSVGFSYALSTGTHLITARATDSGGLASTAAVTVIVGGPANNPPTVAISSPATASSFPYGATVTFSGTASDVQDGNLTANLIWTSSIDGQIGTGGNFSRTLSSGTHAITSRVTDSAGSMTPASITLTVNAPADPPSVSASALPSSSTIASGTPVSFSGLALDSRDGDITALLVWTSSIAGQIGTGGSFTRTLSSGTHTITASVTDSAGLTGKATITVVVAPPPTPTLSATATTDKTSYVNRNVANLRVSVTDGANPVSGATVSIVVTTANGKNPTMSGATGSNGIVNFQYTVNANSGGAGVYSVNATASKSGYNSSTCSTTFTVKK